MQDGRDNKIFTDESGQRWLIDEKGQLLTDEYGDNIPAQHSSKNSEDDVFTTYDTSQGHCALCGRLGCNGSCFK